MKKVCLMMFVLFLGNAFAFAESESWMSLGFEKGNFYEHGSDGSSTVDSYMNSPGIAFKGYTFWNSKNIGLFIHDSFLFPNKLTTTINGEKTTSDLTGC